MNIPVKEEPTSKYTFDYWWSSTEIKDIQEIWHIKLRCRHDHVEVDDGGVYCPDCQNHQLTQDEIEDFLAAYEFGRVYNGQFDPDYLEY